MAQGRPLTAILVSSLAAAAAWAQTPQPDALTEIETLFNTPVMGASKREQRALDSPQAIEVLTGEDLHRMGVYRLVDAFRLMTSVDVLVLDNQVTCISLRGAMQQGQPRNVQVLVDGVPLYNAEIAGVDLDNLPVPIDLVDRIEVVRGPSSSLYGANAVVGVIAITTRNAGAGLQGEARVSRANLGTTRGAASLTLGTGEAGLVLGYQGASEGVSGYRTSYLAPTSGDAANQNHASGDPVTLDQDAGHQGQCFGKATWVAGASTLWLGAGAARKEAGTNAESTYPSQVFQTRTLNAGWGRTWTSALHTEVRLSQLVQTDAFGASADLADAFKNPAYALGEFEWNHITTNQVAAQANYDQGPGLHWVGGLDYRRSVTNPSSVIGFTQGIEDSAFGAFLNLDWNVTEAVTLSGGGREENDTLGGVRFSPRIAALWRLSPDSSLRAGYYAASRSPQEVEARVFFHNTFDLTAASVGLPANTPVRGVFQILPSPGLKPEEVASTELGFRQSFGSFSLDLTLFSMTFTNLIVQAPERGNPVVQLGNPVQFILNDHYVNLQGARNRGVELALDWRPSSRWSSGANATWLHYRIDASAGDAAHTPSYTPGFKANLWTRFSHVGRVAMDVLTTAGATSPAVPRPALDQLSCNLGWQFTPGWKFSLYALNALHPFTPQGAGGPARVAPIQPDRRELGATLSCSF